SDLAGRAGIAAASSSEPMEAVIDAMLRPAAMAPGAAPQAPAAGASSSPQPTRRAAGQAAENEQRSEIMRLLATGAATGLSAQDRAYLAQLVSQRTGLSQQEAEARVNDAIAGARRAADSARRAAVLTAFVTAAGLFISFAAAWWAAIKGGSHRDNSVPAR